MNILLRIFKTFKLIEPDNTPTRIAPLEIVIESAYEAIKLSDTHRELLRVQVMISEALEPYILHPALERYLLSIRGRLQVKRIELFFSKYLTVK